MRTAVGAAGLVGRAAEVERAEHALGQVSAASGHALLITGEAGIGKSRLLRTLIASAQDRFNLAVETTSELESDLPFAPLVRAFGLRPGSSDPHAAALGSLLAESDGGDAEILRLRMIEGIADLVERRALEQPLLLAVEDLHWADDATLQTLDRLARRLRYVGVFIVGTARPHPRPRALEVLERTLADVDAARIELSPLPDAAVMELAVELLGATPGPFLAEALRRAGGNPLYVTELLTAARTELGDGAEEPELPAPGVPDAVRLTILRNLAVLPRGTLDVLRTASVLGTRFDLRQLALTLDRSEVEVASDLLPAFASQVVSGAGEQVTFRHDLVREAVYRDQPDAVRAALHRRVVERLRAAGLPTDELVPHLLRATWSGVPEAVGWLTEAGRAMRARSLPVSAELLARAAREAGDRATPDLLLDLADVLAAAGRHDDAQAALGPLAAVPLDDLDVAVRDRLVALAGPLNRPSSGPSLSLEAIEAAGLSPRGRVQAMSIRAWSHWVEDRRDEATGLAQEALTIATELHDHAAACTLELLLARLEEGRGWDARPVAHARAALDHARRVDTRPELVITASVTLAIMLGNDPSGRAEAGRVVAEALALADRTGLDLHQAALEAVAALNAQRAGDWQDAVVRYEAALDTLPSGDVPIAYSAGTALFHARAARLLVHRDELERAGQVLDVARDLWSRAQTAGQRPDELLHVHLAAAELRLALGDPDGAFDAIDDMVTFVHERDVPIYHVGVLPSVTAIAWQAGRAERAALAAARAERWLDGGDDPTMRDLVRWCRARLDADHETLDALVGWADGPQPLWEWRPMIREDAAAVLTTAGRTDRAVRRLEEALALWDAAGAVRDVARVRQALRELGVRRGRGLAADRPDTGWESLTEAEWRVVELVGEGLIYREIGERLFISRRTVETHVQHVFRKLGIRSRRELADLLATADGRDELAAHR